MSRRIIVLSAFVVWSAVVLSAFYISQRPLALQVVGGASATIWSLALTLWIAFDAAGLGYFIFKRLQLQAGAQERLVMGTGLGLGFFGLAGYAFAVPGLASVPALSVLLITLTLSIFITGSHKKISSDLNEFINSIRESAGETPRWIPPAVVTAVGLGLIYTFLPPAESFDALLYHLRLPQLLIADGRILPYNNFPFWFPSLVEGNYIWALGLKSERTAQMLHWSYALLSLALVWIWSRKAFGNKAAWWPLAILVSMPSLPLLSSWAYSDFGLIFFSLACLYAVWLWSGAREANHLALGGVFAGFAMGVKYTSFILPVVCVLLIAFLSNGYKPKTADILRFSIPAVLAASPWYLRNWTMMGNPFYPFVFGGRYWDSFLTGWYNNTGSGIGWDLREILLLPFTLTQGYRDAVFYDGRIGPLFLLFAPFAVWILWKKRAAPEFKATFIPILFFAVNFAFWTYGVIQTLSLWQSRLLWAGMFALAIPAGLAVSSLEELDTRRVRISFLARSLTGLVIFASLLDSSLFLLARKPLLYALGLESRADYFARVQPEYSEALRLVNSAPEDSSVYFLFEPRSYDMQRVVQPDPINANLAHDYFLYNSPENLIEAWKSNGYTHILVYLPGAEFIQNEGRISESELGDVTKRLRLIAELDHYALYSIP